MQRARDHVHDDERENRACRVRLIAIPIRPKAITEIREAASRSNREDLREDRLVVHEPLAPAVRRAPKHEDVIHRRIKEEHEAAHDQELRAA